MKWIDEHPEVRKAIYGIVSLAVTFALAYELITTEQLELTIGIIERMVVALTALMAFLKTQTKAD